MEHATHIQENKLRKFLPITIIFSLIIIFTAFTTYLHGFSLEFAMRMMMGSFFGIFGAFKVFNLNAFAEAYSTYDILAMRSRAYALTYPFIEILLAVLYLTNSGGIYRDIFALIIMLVSSVGVIIKLNQKEEVPCACLGMVFKVPMTWVTLTEDLLMAVEAMVMIILFINH
ncbi:MAG: MauE/DoxX family redox-associated membrane protein [bacterium]